MLSLLDQSAAPARIISKWKTNIVGVAKFVLQLQAITEGNQQSYSPDTSFPQSSKKKIRFVECPMA
jgi:hypothetical protein